MTKTTITLALVFLYSFVARSADWPDSILQKTFAAQSNFVDTVYKNINGDSARVSDELISLEKWANGKKDQQLMYLTRLTRYRMFLLNEKSNPSVEKDLLELVNQFGKNEYLKTEAMQTLGLYYWSIKKDYAATLEIYLYAYNLYSRFTVGEFPHKPEFQWYLGSCYYRFKDFKLAKQYYHAVITQTPLEKIDNPISKINTLALCYSKLEIYDSSQHYYDYAMDIAKKRNSEEWIGILNGNIADNLHKLGRYDEAIPLYEKDIEIGLRVKDTANTALSMADLSDIYRLKNQNEKALELINRALEMSRKCGRIKPLIRKNIYFTGAKIYESIGDKAKAYDLLDSAVKDIEADQKQSDMASVSGVQHKVDVQTHMADLKTKEAQLDKQRFLRNSFIAGFGLVLFFTIVAYRQKKRLSKEKKRSDSLLLNILPAETAEELKQTGKAAARSFENVTILFTDFKNFTKISEKMSAEELVGEINFYYSHFDEIVAKYNIEKIKTIGDSYMCAGGLPIPSDTHVYDVVTAAIDIMRFNENAKKQRQNEGRPALDIRIGINTGPVIAGIVGIKKFAYDIWGDVVNIASRMESSGEAGKINISETTYNLVKDRFQCEFRGEVPAKNKGMMKMYFVEWRESV